MELDGPRAKYDRAMEHLGVLDSNSVRFVATEPYYVTGDFDSKERGFVLRFRQREPIPLIFSTTVGDVIHNFRSALDHAAWLIASRSIPLQELWKEDVARKVSFPIVQTTDELKGQWIWPRIEDDAKAVLEELQPYHAEDGATSHPFWRLNKLWNVDKHRVLHGGFARIDLSSLSFRPGAIDIDSFPHEVEWRLLTGTVEDGTEIAVVRFQGAPEPYEVTLRMAGQPKAELIFGAMGLGFALSVHDFLVIAGHVNQALIRIAELPELL